MQINSSFLIRGFLIFWLLFSISIYFWIPLKEEFLKKGFQTNFETLVIKQDIEINQTKKEFEGQRYLLSGDNAYERIFNKQGQGIKKLLEGLSKEALPDGWGASVQIEEFTHFFLLVQLPIKGKAPTFDKVVKHIAPIVKYGSPYLSNIAIFDGKHRSYLYFEKDKIKKIFSGIRLNAKDKIDIENTGNKFTKFNSHELKYNEVDGHIYIDATISGPNATYGINMMLDTGATTTSFPIKLIAQTGNEDLNKAVTVRVETANGLITVPVVDRKVTINSLERTIQVHALSKSSTNLLGVNFFKGMEYVIDSKAKTIYAWND